MKHRSVGRWILVPCLAILVVVVMRGANDFAFSEFLGAASNAPDNGQHMVSWERSVDNTHRQSLSSLSSSTRSTVYTALEASALNGIAHTTDRAGARRVNIVLCGADSRIGETYVHADANHLLSILLDSGKIEIISVPRDTPVSLGLDSSSVRNLNILANVRAKRGTAGYLRAMSQICGVGDIPYYVEVGFSQALGIIEFLGYKQPQQTLRVLRSRKIHPGGDFQRVHFQAQFIAQAIRKNFHRLDGIMGDIMLQTGTMFVSTNISASEAKTIVQALRSHAFLKAPDHGITTRMMPPVNIRLKTLDFANHLELDSLYARIDTLSRLSLRVDSSKAQALPPKQLLWQMLMASRADSARPREVIRRLQRPFEQRAWLQVAERRERAELRRWFGELLSEAYTKLGKPEKAAGINKLIRREIEFFLLREQAL
jgi:anionic cell wall polymer biosynthesis LytR-Cps2A-Psr (LCP) family protein